MYVKGNTILRKNINTHEIYSDDDLLFRIYGKDKQYMMMGMTKLPSFKSTCLLISFKPDCNSSLLGALSRISFNRNDSVIFFKSIGLLFSFISFIPFFISFFLVFKSVVDAIIYSFIYYE